MATPQELTSHAAYLTDLAAAQSLYDSECDRFGSPEGEYEKRRDDMLNNTWEEGITLREWVDRAVLG